MNDESITSRLGEFAVQVSWSSGEFAGGTGIDVTYAINGAQHVDLIPFAIWLCAAECPEDLSGM